MNFNIKKREIVIFTATVIIGLFMGYIFFHSSEQNVHQSEVQQNDQAATVWTCSMHPQIRSHEPGLCPICAMDLVPVETQPDDEEHIAGAISLSESAVKLAAIQTTLVRSGIPEKTLHLTGKILPDERNIAKITARFGGRIEKLQINFTGQQVKKGQTLGVIYSPDLISAQKELIEALKYGNSNPSLYESAKNKLRFWNISERQIDNIEKSGIPQTYFDVYSPIDGTVTGRHVTAGEYIKEGSVLFTVVNLNNLWVLFDAYENNLPWIKTGDEVHFTVQALPGLSFKGKVSFIDPVIDPMTRTAGTRVEVANHDLKLKPGMFASGTIKSRLIGMENALLIPKSAVLWTGKRAIVYIKQRDRSQPTFLMREIVLGPDAGNEYVVIEGLQVGEEIASNGVFKIDAAAQLAGLPSMMNPQEGAVYHSDHMHGSDSEDRHDIDHSASLMEKFKVFGNCSMCKDRIEEAAGSIPGVMAEWDQQTKMITASFDPQQVRVAEIHQIIAAAGHDTENEKAPDEVYKKLPPCCSYRD